MIKRLKLHNFRTFLNAEFAFSQRHLVIGRNNSGKTNFMLGLKFLANTAGRALSDCTFALPGGVWEFCNFSVFPKDRMAVMEIECEPIDALGRVRFMYRLRLEVLPPSAMQSGPPTLAVREETLMLQTESNASLTLIESDGRKARIVHADADMNGLSTTEEVDAPSDATMLSKLYDSAQNGAAGLFRGFLQSVSYFNLSAQSIRHGWIENSDTKGLFVNGSNLASMLYVLKTEEDSRYRRVLERVKRIEPALKAINFNVGPEQRVVPQVELAERDKATWVGLSDGTLRALAISYIIELSDIQSRMMAPFGVCILLEEPENSLYIGEVQSITYDVENSSPSTQYLFTTHSPYFIDQFDHDLDAVTLLTKEGSHTKNTTLKSRQSEITKALEEMSLGEQYFREMLK